MGDDASGGLGVVTIHGPDGVVRGATHADLLAAVADDGDVWIDLQGPDGSALRLLGDDLGVHPLVVEDAVAFDRGLGIASFGDSTQAVVRAVSGPDDDLVHFHVVHLEGVVITVRHDACDAVDMVAEWAGLARELDRGARFVLFRLLLSVADSYLDPLARIDDRLDDLEDELLGDASGDHLIELTGLRRRLSDYRRSVAPLRNRLAGGASIAIRELADGDEAIDRYARDVYDQLVHVTESIEAERDYVESVMDVYLTMVSNAQNQVMKQLTLVATIFLPLSFLVGFFGMNFEAMVRNLRSPVAFFALGVGIPLAIVGWLAWSFRRRGWA